MRAFLLEEAFYSRGQIAPVMLFGVLVGSAILVLMFNTAQKITEKSNVTNAADAAAYSGAVWTARHLNFLAYSNRAMIANDIAVGHYVSYTSWLRYVHNSIKAVRRIATWLPYVRPYIEAAEDIVGGAHSANERIAGEVVQGIDALNGSYRAAQAEAQASLALNQLNELMRATARAYDPTINVNDNDDLNRMPDVLRTAIQARLLTQLAAVPNFVQRYTVSKDKDVLKEVVDGSIGLSSDNRRWITGRRGWKDNSLIIREIRKDGSTVRSQTDAGADWRATDRIRYRNYSFPDWGSWHTLGKRQQARARELYSDYRGVPSYYNVAGKPGDQSLRIGVLASKRQNAVRTAALLGMQPTGEPIAAAALARVEFKRPSGGAFPSLGRSRAEYANLFNPFWEARLAALDLGLGL